ncbi:MAG: hypothetical protein ABEH86_07350 [Haloarcula sp.]
MWLVSCGRWFDRSSGSRGTRWSRPFGQGSDDDKSQDGPLPLVKGQIIWMAVMLGLLFLLELWSARLYFVVSFIGLLINRLLFAPVRRGLRWWRITNILIWIGFGVLSYLIYLRVQVLLLASG